MRAGRRLTTALAAAAVALSTAFVAGPVAAAPGADDATPPDAALTTRDVQPLPPPAPLVVAAPGSARTSSARAARRPLFAFWGKKYNRVDGFGFTSAVRGSGTGVQVQAAWKTYRGVKPIKPKKVLVQARVDGSKWRKVKGVRGTIGRQLVTARIPAHVVPAGIPVQRVDYRLKTKKITKGPRRARRSVASKPVSIWFENQAMYTGDKARFYAPIASLCPNANITIDTTGLTGENDAVFHWQYGITIDTASLAAIPYEPEESRLAIAIHECAHMKQFYNWGGTQEDWSTLRARSAEVFVPDNNPDPSVPTPPMSPRWEPLEHAADCATELVSPSRFRTYGGYCNPTEHAAAGLLWQNQRY